MSAPLNFCLGAAYSLVDKGGEDWIKADMKKVDETIAARGCALYLLMVIGMFLLAGTVKGDYVVIDVSEGKDAVSYPISRLEKLPSDGWGSDYKTVKIVLAEIKPGTFMRRRAVYGDPFISMEKSDSVPVSVKQPYRIGVFPITQRQWELVMGTRPSSFKNEKSYAMRPVDSVSYVMIRGKVKGTGYPHTTEVDDDSFLGVLRKKTGLPGLDIPTEDQWEYACHGGKDSQYGNGDDNPVSMLELGRYSENSQGLSASKSASAKEGTSEVGQYAPNDWGLYDMQGGVWEWCLDAACPQRVPQRRTILSIDVDRILKGGCWESRSIQCAASVRAAMTGSSGYDNTGFRLALTGAVGK